jgi:alkaline phosphatase D
MDSISRRSLVKGTAAAVGIAIAGTSPAQAAMRASPTPLVRKRLPLPSGISTGDVTSNSAILWSRASGPGQLIAKLRAVDDDGRLLRGSGSFDRVIQGGWATPECDFTAKIQAEQLPPGTRFDLTLHFEGSDGNLSEAGQGTFSTAPGRGRGGSGTGPARTARRRSQSFVWTGDTAGQGWGINEEIGGMRGYAAMHATNPDFFIHSGDTIYADGPIAESVTEPDGQIWRNLVTEGVHKVAETLDEFRGRHRYNMLDANIRAMYADVPVIAQWDDHETHNNWYPGEIIDDPRYSVRDVDVLAARGRRAWQEYMPIADARAMRPGTGFESARIYRKTARGPQLDVFSLDMRSFKSPNTTGLEPQETPLLGEDQVQWLIRAVSRSAAIWKVIAADLPIGIIVPDGQAQESMANRDDGEPLGRELELARILKAFKDNHVSNVVFVTADVHYCAAHHYSPDRAAFKDFNPFWEFVAGPIAAGSFGPSPMDLTFGPRVDFAKSGTFANQSPRTGDNQYFGHMDIDEDGVLDASLRDANGTVIYTRRLTPER